MRRLVEGLLDLARLDAGQGNLARGPVDLGALLRSVAEGLELRAAEKGIRLRQEVGPLPALAGDGDRLRQVFTNLLDNALKHTAQGGAVTVAAAASDGAVEVVVIDTGPGIPAEDLPRIFERFYQVDKSRKAAGRGAGLGLAISREIVLAHGGSLRAESVVGLGSKFVVRLPIAGEAVKRET
jgi:signal transduction histidine kinase